MRATRSTSIAIIRCLPFWLLCFFKEIWVIYSNFLLMKHPIWSDTKVSRAASGEMSDLILKTIIAWLYYIYIAVLSIHSLLNQSFISPQGDIFWWDIFFEFTPVYEKEFRTYLLNRSNYHTLNMGTMRYWYLLEYIPFYIFHNWICHNFLLGYWVDSVDILCRSHPNRVEYLRVGCLVC